MKLELPAHAGRLLALFREEGFPPVYLVGGFVRNRLLGLPEGDLDIAGGFPPERFSGLRTNELTVCERVYGLGTVVLKQTFRGRRYVYEYTAFRCDNYGRGGAHVPEKVAFTEDMGTDAQRRDFTVNALYAGEDGAVLDPTGRGLAALGQRVIRQVRKDTLAEDALRILRMVRLASELGFSVEEETYACAKRYACQLGDISAERIRDEFLRILMADTKYGEADAVGRGLHMLKDLGAFAYIFPRLCEGDGVKQSERYHAYDVMEHGIRTCACAPPDVETRLAALLHDIAKPAALRENGRMLGHDRMGADLAEEALRGLRFEKATVGHVGALVREHMFDLNNDAGKKAVIRVITRLGREQFLKLCALREADFCGSGKGNVALSAQKWREILKELLDNGAPLKRSDLAVNGDDLMRELEIPPGQQVGELLRALHEYAVKKPSQNNYKSLIRYAKIVNTRRRARNVPRGTAGDAGEFVEGSKRV